LGHAAWDAQVKPDGVRFIGQVIADVGGREPSSSSLPYRYSPVRAWHQVVTMSQAQRPAAEAG
jgi:hypothetical protein